MAQDSSDNNNFSNFDNFDDNLAQPSTSTGKACLFYIDLRVINLIHLLLTNFIFLLFRL